MTQVHGVATHILPPGDWFQSQSFESPNLEPEERGPPRLPEDSNVEREPCAEFTPVLGGVSGFPIKPLSMSLPLATGQPRHVRGADSP